MKIKLSIIALFVLLVYAGAEIGNTHLFQIVIKGDSICRDGICKHRPASSVTLHEGVQLIKSYLASMKWHALLQKAVSIKKNIFASTKRLNNSSLNQPSNELLQEKLQLEIRDTGARKNKTRQIGEALLFQIFAKGDSICTNNVICKHLPVKIKSDSKYNGSVVSTITNHFNNATVRYHKSPGVASFGTEAIETLYEMLKFIVSNEFQSMKSIFASTKWPIQYPLGSFLSEIHYTLKASLHQLSIDALQEKLLGVFTIPWPWEKLRLDIQGIEARKKKTGRDAHLFQIVVKGDSICAINNSDSICASRISKHRPINTHHAATGLQNCFRVVKHVKSSIFYGSSVETVFSLSCLDRNRHHSNTTEHFQNNIIWVAVASLLIVIITGFSYRHFNNKEV